MKRNCHIKGLALIQFSDGTDFTLPGSTEDRYTYAYSYDGNGNMTLDALRNITLTYDINNLVSTVSRNDTLLSTYHYLADGTKYKVMDPDNNGRVYIGPFFYTTAKSGNTVYSYLEGIDTDGGRIMVVRKQSGTQNTYDYTTAFFVRDHLGSTRVMLNSQGDILERNAYYPFGLQMNQGKAYPTLTQRLPQLYSGYVSSTPARRDLYNGKELQTAAGTDYLDYGFRQYDQTIARWFNIDPKAEKYLQLTPYNYCAGNPIRNTDIGGLLIDDYYDYMTGRYLGTDGSSTNNLRIIREDIFRKIVDKNGGQTDSKEATLELQDSKNSKIITVDYEKINNDVITIADKSHESKIENALYLILDRDKAEITSELSSNQNNTNNRSYVNGTWAPSTSVLYRGYGRIVIAQVHGHPDSDSFSTTESTASKYDAAVAKQYRLPIYAVDAFEEREGRQTIIHRGNTDGSISKGIGFTTGKGVEKVFDLVKDALNRR